MDKHKLNNGVPADTHNSEQKTLIQCLYTIDMYGQLGLSYPDTPIPDGTHYMTIVGPLVKKFPATFGYQLMHKEWGAFQEAKDGYTYWYPSSQLHDTPVHYFCTATDAIAVLNLCTNMRHPDTDALMYGKDDFYIIPFDHDAYHELVARLRAQYCKVFVNGVQTFPIIPEQSVGGSDSSQEGQIV